MTNPTSPQTPAPQGPLTIKTVLGNKRAGMSIAEVIKVAIHNDEITDANGAIFRVEKGHLIPVEEPPSHPAPALTETPETDSAAREHFQQYGSHAFVKADFARTLERQRDEARGLLAQITPLKNSDIRLVIKLSTDLQSALSRATAAERNFAIEHEALVAAEAGANERIADAVSTALREQAAAHEAELAKVEAERDEAQAERDEARKERDEANRIASIEINARTAQIGELDSLRAQLTAAKQEVERAQNDLGLLGMDYDLCRKERDSALQSLATAKEAGDLLEGIEAMKDKIFGIWWQAHPLDQTWTVTGNPTDSYSGGIPMGEGLTLRAALRAALTPKGETK
jgi:DNA repair exonuclease SbcCD ATPase subunit